MPFAQARHPNRLQAVQTRIVEDLLEMLESHGQKPVDAIIEMLEDLHLFGRDSRYVRKMKTPLVWELKTQSRGGVKGGARVYFFVDQDEQIIVVNAECKDGDEPSLQKLKEVTTIALAHINGIAVVRGA